MFLIIRSTINMAWDVYQYNVDGFVQEQLLSAADIQGYLYFRLPRLPHELSSGTGKLSHNMLAATSPTDIQ